jgi:uncharacterized protein YeaO (DUF488 family)
MSHPIVIERIYEPPRENEGMRILVDRLWPRGVSKDRAHVDVWMKDVAPNPELRKWFGHDPARFADFRLRYEDELANDPLHQAKVAELHQLAESSPLTLLYAAKDGRCNHAIVLLDFLQLQRNI